MKIIGAVISLLGERELVNKKVRLSPSVENHTFAIPEGFVNSSNEEINTNNQASKKLTLIDLLINPFSYFFKR